MRAGGCELSLWLGLVAACVVFTPANGDDTPAQSPPLDAAALRAELDETSKQLVRTLQRLYFATSPELRPDLLLEMLADEKSQVRAAGCDILQRVASEGGELPSSVGAATLGLLRDHSPALRSKGASLIRQLAPAGGATVVAEALAVETDATVASGLMLAAMRWPRRDLVGPALAWANGPSTARPAAYELLWRLWNTGDLNDPRQIQRAIELARWIDDSDLTTPAISLLAALGGPEDEQRLLRLLYAEAPSVRTASAEALLWEPRHRENLLRAATHDATLFPQAAMATLVHNPGREELLALLALPHADQAEFAPAVQRVLESMSGLELLAAGSDTQLSPVLRRRVLREAISERHGPGLTDTREWNTLRGRASCDLADLALDAGDVDEALNAINTTTGLDAACGVERLHDLRTASLLGFGRLELLTPGAGSPSAWLRGVQLAAEKPHATAALAAFEDRFPVGSRTAETSEAITRARRAVLQAQERAAANAQKGPG